MAKAKGSAVTFSEFPDIKISWDSMNGRHSIKKERIGQPVGFVAPSGWDWIIQNPNLTTVAGPIKDRREALRTAAAHFTAYKSKS